MYRKLICIFAALMWFSTTAQAFGLLGNEASIGMATPAPNGLSAKLWMSRDTAIDLFSEWDTTDKHFQMHADYLTHDFQQFETEGATMPMYFGFGIRLRTTESSATSIGIRIPIGVSYLWNTAPIDFFAEVGPRANIIPRTSFAVDLMVGLRYRFIP
jgi:hypothetical protein